MKKNGFILLGLISALIGASDAQTNCIFYSSNDKPFPGETIHFYAQFFDLKPKTKVKLSYYYFDSLIYTDRNSEEFIFTPNQAGYFEMKAVVEYSQKGKIYKFDTLDISFNCIEPIANIDLFRENISLYHQVPLVFEVNAPNMPVSDLVLTFNNCAARKIGTSRFELIAEKTHVLDTAKILISIRSGDTLKILNNYSIPIREVPYPGIHILYYGLSSDSVFTLNPVPSGPYDYPYTKEVKSFRIQYTLNGKTVTHFIEGDKVTPEISKEIRLLESGSWIYFEDITFRISYSGKSSVWMTSNTAFKLP